MVTFASRHQAVQEVMHLSDFIHQLYKSHEKSLCFVAKFVLWFPHGFPMVSPAADRSNGPDRGGGHRCQLG